MKIKKESIFFYQNKDQAMMTTSKKIAVLRDKFYENGNTYYRLTDGKGKDITLYFPTDVCPNAKIGDEMYFEYKRSLNQEKKGYYLTNNINDAIFHKIPRSVALLNAILISSFIAAGITVCLFLGIYLSLPIPVSLLLVSLVYISVILSFELGHARFFSKTKEKKYPKYKDYKEGNFTKKERLLDKIMSDTEKESLCTFINNQDDLSSSQKIEINDIISSSKKFRVSSISYLETRQIKRRKRLQAEALKS